jgi:hypothetical protein
MNKPNITPEVIEALRTLRKIAWGGDVEDAVNTLDNAGIFAAIDEVTGYGVDSNCTCPAIERERSGTDNHYIECPEAPVSKCTCRSTGGGVAPRGRHWNGCPGNPAEYGDSAYVQVGSDEWHRRMGQALAQTPLYAHRVEAPAGKCSCYEDSWAPAGSHRGSCQHGSSK